MADKIILDSCALQPEGQDLNLILYQGRKGLANITAENISGCMERIGQIDELMGSYDLIVIPQVLEEISTGLEYLNIHINYFNQMARSKQNRRVTNKRGRKWRDKVNDFEREDFEEVLCNLNTYSGRINRLVRKVNQDSQRIHQDDEMYQMLLEMARSKELSGDLDVDSLARRNWMRNYTELGANLETDKHIVATAFRLSYGEILPLIILTSDGGLTTLINRMKDGLQNPDFFRQKYGFLSALPANVTREWTSTFLDKQKNKNN